MSADAAAPAAVVYAALASRSWWLCDDAFISFRYARNLVAGHGLTFNVGDRTVVATGKVVWATDTDPITQEVGIEFYEIDPEAMRMLEEALEPELEPVGLF